LTPSELEYKRTARTQPGGTLCNDAPEYIHTVGSTVIRKRILEREGIALQQWKLARGHVWNHCDYHVHSAAHGKRQRGKETTEQGIHTVASRAGNRATVYIRGDDARPWMHLLQNAGDGSASRTQVDGRSAVM
jgi:hypothetical protein